MKLPNDLIKSTDLEKTKDRIIHEFKCVNGKIIQSYALGGEHELTTQEIVDCLNGLATIDCDLQTAYAYIKGQDEKNKLLVKRWESLKSYIADTKPLRGTACYFLQETLLEKMQEIEKEEKL